MPFNIYKGDGTMGKSGFVGREAFLRDLEPFFGGGFAHEIYFHKKGSIMNLANSLYIASMYLKDNLGYSIGIIVPKEVAKVGTEDWMALLQWFNALSDSDKEHCVMLFAPKTLEAARQIKARTDVEGPTENVDLEWEQRLKTEQSLKQESPSHGFLSKLWKALRGKA